LGPTHPGLHRVQGAFVLEIKQVKDEADHYLSPSSAEVKNKYSYTLHSPSYRHGMDRDTFTLQGYMPKVQRQKSEWHIRSIKYFPYTFKYESVTYHNIGLVDG
jgi:hypothetical protein